jgi:hypothetical protein
MPALGSFMGFGVGFTLLHKRDFKGFVFGAFSDRFFRYSIGLIGGLFFFYGVKSVSIDVLGAKGSLEIVIDFLRYFLLVFWVVYGVPHLFRHKHPLKTYSSSPELSQT